MKPNVKTLKKMLIDQDIVSYAELARRCGCTRVFMGYLIKGQRRSDRYEACVARVLGIQRDHLDRLLRP
jgi:cyanate lyase